MAIKHLQKFNVGKSQPQTCHLKNRPVVEWIELLLLERWTRVRFPVWSNPKTRKIGIHSFPALRSAIKETMCGLHRVW